jgi:hypothetical protein
VAEQSVLVDSRVHKLQLGTMGRLDGLEIGAMGNYRSCSRLRMLNSPNSATYPQQAAHCELAKSSMHDTDLD